MNALWLIPIGVGWIAFKFFSPQIEKMPETGQWILWYSWKNERKYWKP